MSVKKDTQQFLLQLEAQGFEITPTRNSHVWIKAPDGKDMTTASTTPSNYRGFKNLRAWARRNGFDDRQN